ncbi:MAG: nucleotidyltransferase domain-containing protein [bacterium]
MNENDLRIASRFKELVEKKVRIKRFIVFGSRVRGDAFPESDLDVLVEVESLTADINEYIMDCAWEAGFEELIHVSPAIYTSDELTNGSQAASILVETALSEGVPV